MVSAVQENSAAQLDKRAALPFAKYLVTHGLTPATALFTVRQLIDERRDAGVKWRRAFALDAMSYDVFRNLVRRNEVAFATFFSNSTAHLQHYYWRNFRPEIFSLPSPPEDHTSLSDAMLQGYRNNDQLIGRFLADFPDDRLIFATALSQQPWDTTKCTYRPKDFDKLLRLIGIDMTGAEVAPLMAEEFLLSFSDESAADRAIAKLTECRVGDEPLFRMQDADGPRFKAGCAINKWSPDRTMLTLPDANQVPFDDYFYRIHSLRSGRHHPDGCFWVQSATPRRIDERYRLRRWLRPSSGSSASVRPHT